MPTTDDLYDEAIALKEAGELDGAIGKLEALLAEHPGHALAHAALSVFCVQANRDDEAIEHSRKVCELEPDDPFSFMAMSMVCQKAGNLAEAESALAEAMQKQWGAQKTPEA